MKKIISTLILCVLCISLAGCAKTYHGIDELMEKAREEIPVSDADTIELDYAGMCRAKDRALVWFVSGNDYQAHYYLPMEVTVTGEESYRFVCTRKPIIRARDIAVLNWNNGYAFVINNSDCAEVRITDETGMHSEMMADRADPYVFYWPDLPLEYSFWDINGTCIGG